MNLIKKINRALCEVFFEIHPQALAGGCISKSQ